MTIRIGRALALLIGFAGFAGCQPASPAHKPTSQDAATGSVLPVRCAVIGGITMTGLWPALAERFKDETGIEAVVAVTGNKDIIAPAFIAGEIDLIVMHSSDTIINLVADGYASDPQPWLKNDLVIVGPSEDPAGIRGLTNAAEAIRRISDKEATFVVHHSLGAQEVLRGIMADGHVTLDPERTIMRLDERQGMILKFTAEQKSYTLVGRIPFLSGRMPNAGLELLVRDDPRLRRPYLAAVASPQRLPGVRVALAQRLVVFLRSPATQAFIAEFGRGKFDDRPIFFRIDAETSEAAH